MESVAPHIVVALAAVAFVAGFVDAIAGGGGLITVPALALAGLDPVAAVATNKLQASFGSGAAAFSFWRAGRLRITARALAMAGAGSLLGAMALTLIPRDAIRLLLPAALVVIALYFALSPRMSDVPSRPRLGAGLFTATIIPLVGFYDGVFGPGTGSFYMLGLVALTGLPVIEATGQTKALNFASNVVSLAILALHGHIIWIVGLAMIPAQVAGASLGARLAMRRGTALIKPLIVVVCLAMALRLAADYV